MKKLAALVVVVASSAACPVGLPGLIVEFSASSTLVGPNEEFTLTWQTLNTKSCSVVGDSAPADHASNGSGTVKLANVGQHKYTLQCIANDGSQIQSAPLVVSVNAADVHIKSDTDVKNLNGATEIKGSLVFDPGCSITDVGPLSKLATIGGDLDYQCKGIANLTLAALAHVGGNVVIHGGDATMTELHFDALVDTGADFSIKDLPKLKTASANALATVGQDLVVSAYDYPSYPSTFPNEANDDCTQDQKQRTLPFLTELDLPALATVGRELTTEDAGELSALSLPALQSVGAAVIITGLGNNTASASVSMPQLRSAGTLLVVLNPSLTSLSVPALATTKSDPAVDDYSGFPTPDPRDPLLHVYQVFLSDISCVGFGVIPAPRTGDVFLLGNGPDEADNSNLTTLDLSGLTDVASTLWLTDLAQSTLAFPNLTSVGSMLVLRDHQLTSLQMPALTTITGTFPVDFEEIPLLDDLELSALTASPNASITLNPQCPGLTTLSLGNANELGSLEIDDVGATSLAQIGVVTVDHDLKLGALYPNHDANGLQTLTNVGGNLDLDGQFLTSLTGFENVTTIGGTLIFDSDATLANATGLGKLTSVGAIVVDDDNLATIQLNALTTIAGVDSSPTSIDISFDDALDKLELPALTSFTGGFSTIAHDTPHLTVLDLGTITGLGDVFIGDTLLTNVDAFCSVTSMNSLSMRDNTKLADLGGFANVHIATTLDIFASFATVSGQPLLSACEVETLLEQSGATAGQIDSPAPSGPGTGCPLPDTCGAAGEGEGAAGEGEGAAGEGEGEGAAGEGEGEGAAGEGEGAAGEGEGAAGEGEGAAGEGEGEGAQ